MFSKLEGVFLSSHRMIQGEPKVSLHNVDLQISSLIQKKQVQSAFNCKPVCLLIEDLFICQVRLSILEAEVHAVLFCL